MRAALDEGYVEATDVAEFLVKKGIAFRTAYQAAKQLVEHCMHEKRTCAKLCRLILLPMRPLKRLRSMQGSLRNILTLLLVLHADPR